jgi:uncharacterized protein involved in exopolysaccharide biosynthesis
MKEMSLNQLVSLLLAGWVRITIAAIATGVIFAAVGISSDKVFESSVVLFPQESSNSAGLTSQLGQLGGIAGLMGLNLGGSKVRDESLAVLRSRVFSAAFIQQHDLIPQLTRAKALPFMSSASQMKMQDAIDYFDSKIRTIYDDKKLGTVKITMRWQDAAGAATLANEMARQLNLQVRQQVIQEATNNITYLRSELQNSQLVSISQAIGSLLEGELKRLMLARGSEEYAFRILDPAQPATRPVWPRPVFMAALGILLGGMLAFLSLVLPRVLNFRPIQQMAPAQRGAEIGS